LKLEKLTITEWLLSLSRRRVSVGEDEVEGTDLQGNVPDLLSLVAEVVVAVGMDPQELWGLQN